MKGIRTNLTENLKICQFAVNCIKPTAITALVLQSLHSFTSSPSSRENHIRALTKRLYPERMVTL